MSSPPTSIKEAAGAVQEVGMGQGDDTVPTVVSTAAAVPATSTARPIYSFWTSAAGPSNGSSSSLSTAGSPAPSYHNLAPKKKRKATSQAQNGNGQGRLVLNGEGGAWGIQRVEKDVPPSHGKGKARTRDTDGEAGEVKEMAKRARASKKAVPSREEGEEAVIELRDTCDSSCIGPASPAAQSTISPNAKPRVFRAERGRQSRPRKSQLSARTTPDLVVDLVSSDPVVPSCSPRDVYPNLLGATLLNRLPLSRTASASSRGAEDDPIDVETEDIPVLKPGPKKLVFASDSKPVHGFFSMARQKVPVDQVDESVHTPDTEGRIAVQPDSPPQPSSGPATSAPAPVKPLPTHSFFSLAGSSSAPGKSKTGWGNGVKEGEEWLAPLPRNDDQPPAATFAWPVEPPPTLLRKPSRPQKPSADDEGQIADLIDTGAVAPRQSKASQNLGLAGTSPDHPALHAVKQKTSRADRETWAEKYRPTKSAHVLGNELEATYLRDWLQTLSLSSPAQDQATPSAPRKVFRKVKRVRPQLFDGWIVDDAGAFGDPVTEEEEEDYVEFYEPEYALGDRPRNHPSLLDAQLTNTILLVGDHGCGKTAAIYAAADELGWEVFEVYPGLGRRTGGNLMGWVGDVGKNHLVAKSATVPKAPEKGQKKKNGGLGTFFAPKVVLDDEDPIALTSSQGSMGDPIQVDAEEEENGGQAGRAVSDPAFRQSLILIDEADIQFSEEQTFWPAVVSLIAESRRPVILTCNDLRRIPIETLPLQTILHFHPPPQRLAKAYLEAVASRQGLPSPHSVAEHIYEFCTRRAPGHWDQPLPPNGNEPLPHFDLRRALTQMQLNGTFDVEQVTVDITPQEDATVFELLVRAVETASWSDAHVAPRPWAVMDTIEIDRHEPIADDELGLRLLVKPDIHDVYPAIPAYDASHAMAQGIQELANSNSTLLPPLGDLQTARGLLPLLDPLIVLSAPLLPSPTLFTLYMPALQRMIEADDVLETEEEEAVARGEGRWNRKTGRPKRATRGDGEGGGYARYIDLDEVALQAARDSALVC